MYPPHLQGIYIIMTVLTRLIFIFALFEAQGDLITLNETQRTKEWAPKWKRECRMNWEIGVDMETIDYVWLPIHKALVVKNPPANAGDIKDSGSIPGLGRSLGGQHGNLLQYSCLENPMDRGTWWAIVHTVTKSQTWLKQLSLHYV